MLDMPLPRGKAPSIKNCFGGSRLVTAVTPWLRFRNCSILELNPTVVPGGEGAAGVAGVYDAFGLDQHYFTFIGGERLVLDAFGDDVELAGAQRDFAVAEAEGHRAFDDDEDFVGVGMSVPDELALQAY